LIDKVFIGSAIADENVKKLALVSIGMGFDAITDGTASGAVINVTTFVIEPSLDFASATTNGQDATDDKDQ